MTKTKRFGVTRVEPTRIGFSWARDRREIWVYGHAIWFMVAVRVR